MIIINNNEVNDTGQINAEYLRLRLSSFHLLLWPPLFSMTNFIMWNALHSSLWTVLSPGCCVLNVGPLTSGRLQAPPVF